MNGIARLISAVVRELKTSTGNKLAGIQVFFAHDTKLNRVILYCAMCLCFASKAAAASVLPPKEWILDAAPGIVFNTKCKKHSADANRSDVPFLIDSSTI